MKTTKMIIKKIIGQRLISIFRDYSIVPGLLLRELSRMVILIRNKRKYVDDPEVLLCELRTAAHIVDKGIQADNWEKGRGGEPYNRLCKLIEKSKRFNIMEDPSYCWAYGRKIAYEEAQKSGKNYFDHNAEVVPANINKNDLLNLIQGRRSIRFFENRQIPFDILEELANVINWSPTSCNRQPTKLFITQEPTRVETCLKQCAGATSLGEITPCFISVCSDTRFYMIKDRNLSFIDTCLGLQNMLLMAHCQGIEATILNWMHHTPEEDRILRATLEIPEFYTIIANLIIGYPARITPPPGRKAANKAYVIVG